MSAGSDLGGLDQANLGGDGEKSVRRGREASKVRESSLRGEGEKPGENERSQRDEGGEACEVERSLW